MRPVFHLMAERYLGAEDRAGGGGGAVRRAGGGRRCELAAEIAHVAFEQPVVLEQPGPRLGPAARAAANGGGLNNAADVGGGIVMNINDSVISNNMATSFGWRNAEFLDQRSEY